MTDDLENNLRYVLKPLPEKTCSGCEHQKNKIIRRGKEVYYGSAFCELHIIPPLHGGTSNNPSILWLVCDQWKPSHNYKKEIKNIKKTNTLYKNWKPKIIRHKE